MSSTWRSNAVGRPRTASGLPLPACPKCNRSDVVELVKSMRRYSCSDDWYRCDKCEHLYTSPRPTEGIGSWTRRGEPACSAARPGFLV